MTSPLFVRSYVPRVLDPQRQVMVLTPGSNYRWRAEGYASTRIGPAGMPGQTRSFDATPPHVVKVALWGDSQAEGVCVPDKEKVHSFVAQASAGEIEVYPLARSGDDCNDWLFQIEQFERAESNALRFDAHVFLLVEWQDWTVPISDSHEPDVQWSNRASSVLPGFLIQASRNLLTTGTENRARTLRFRPGPVSEDHPSLASTQTAPNLHSDPSAIERLKLQLDRLADLTQARCVFLYAPLLPQIAAGSVQDSDPDEQRFSEFSTACTARGFACVDLRPAMVASVATGQWPRGFHNGQFGVGHYNAIGNERIANALIQAIASPDSQSPESMSNEPGI